MKTVQVKIAIAVDPRGRWYAYSSGDGERSFPGNHDELLETVDVDQCGPSEKLYWITAELEVPEPETAAGEVTTVD